MPARITLVKTEVAKIAKRFFPSIEKIEDTGRVLTPKECPAICISSDHPSAYGIDESGYGNHSGLISLDIYLIRDQHFNGIDETDLVTQNIISYFFDSRHLGGLVRSIKPSALRSESIDAENHIRAIFIDLEYEYTYIPDDDVDSANPDWNLQTKVTAHV